MSELYDSLNKNARNGKVDEERKNMLSVLYEMEKALPALLAERGRWQSVFVNYHPPFVERLWTQVGENRLYLHRIHPCDRAEALFHPHPWPSAMRILDGSYEMAVGYGKGMHAPPAAATMILQSGSVYEMVDRHGWHYVRPLDRPTLSVMVTGVPWKRSAPKSDKRLTALEDHVVKQLLVLFGDYYR